MNKELRFAKQGLVWAKDIAHDSFFRFDGPGELALVCGARVAGRIENSIAGTYAVKLDRELDGEVGEVHYATYDTFAEALSALIAETVRRVLEIRLETYVT